MFHKAMVFFGSKKIIRRFNLIYSKQTKSMDLYFQETIA